MLNLKTTPFEEVINEYIKAEIKLHYAKEHKNEKHTVKIPNEFLHEQLKDITQSIFSNFYEVVVKTVPLSKNCESIIIDANIEKL